MWNSLDAMLDIIQWQSVNMHQKHGCEDDLTNLFLEFVLWLQLKGKKLRLKSKSCTHLIRIKISLKYLTEKFGKEHLT